MPAYFTETQNKTEINQVRSICKTLFQWSIGHLTRLYIVSHTQNHKTLKQKCPPHLLDIINNRLIYRITAQIAEKEKAEAIVTGETIKEKPHQTLRLFKLQDQAVQDYPIHRPLTGLTNTEIRELAQKIGIPQTLTAKPKISEEAVLPTLKEVETIENKLNIQKMIDTALEKLETTSILL